jgi:predicted component of type VI protein secretion system
MNLQIISDSQNHVGTTNHTNEFTMSLNHEIDAENNNTYIRVLNVCYPLTVKNVLEDDCWLQIKFDFKDFKSKSIHTPNSTILYFQKHARER